MAAKDFVRPGMLLITGQVLTALIGMAALRVYTELLPANVFGEATLIMTALALGLQVFVAPLTAVQLRYHTQAQARGNADRYTLETLSWSLRAATLLGGLILLAFGLSSLASRREYGLAVVITAILWLYAMTLRNVLISRIQAERRRRVYVGFQVLEALLLVVLPLASLSVAATVQFFIVGQALAVLVSLAVLVALTKWPKHEVGETRDTGFWSGVKSYGLPFVPISLMNWLANLADRYTLAFLVGTQATGLYVAPFSIASRGMNLANTALCDLFRPILFDAENRGDAPAAQGTFLVWVGANVTLSVAGLVVIGIFGESIVRLMLAEAYRVGAVSIMLWVASGYAVSSFTQILENRLLSMGRPANLLTPTALGALSNVAFSFWLISRNGVIGAAQATCASFVVQSLVTLGFLLSALKKNQPEVSVGGYADGAEPWQKIGQCGSDSARNALDRRGIGAARRRRRPRAHPR